MFLREPFICGLKASSPPFCRVKESSRRGGVWCEGEGFSTCFSVILPQTDRLKMCYWTLSSLNWATSTQSSSIQRPMVIQAMNSGRLQSATNPLCKDSSSSHAYMWMFRMTNHSTLSASHSGAIYRPMPNLRQAILNINSRLPADHRLWCSIFIAKSY